MSSALRFDLSGVGIAVDEPDAARAARWRRDWASFVSGDAAAAGDPFVLDVAIEPIDADAPAGNPYLPKEMRAEFDGPRARFALPEGEADVARPARCRIRLPRSIEDRAYFTAHNLVRAALAWCLAPRRIALVHAAAVAVDGRAWALVGASGTGKTTWAEQAEAGGALVLADDLALVDASSSDGVAVLGAPFRSTHRGARRPGRWPLAAWLHALHGLEPALAPVPDLLAGARLAANLPFVADAVERDADVAATLEALAAAPTRRLTFAPDPGFLELLRAGKDA